MSEKRLQNDVHYPDLGNASDWLKQTSLATPPTKGTISLEFLCLLPQTSDFAGKPAVASQIVSCFLRLKNLQILVSFWVLFLVNIFIFIS